MKANFKFIKNTNCISKVVISVMFLTAFFAPTLKTNAQEAITVPNIFTPNNDGINDEFKVDLNGIVPASFNMSIYANWGILVFHSGNSNVSWDGRTTSGMKATEGNYFYVVNCNGKEYKGTIMLLD